MLGLLTSSKTAYMITRCIIRPCKCTCGSVGPDAHFWTQSGRFSPLSTKDLISLCSVKQYPQETPFCWIVALGYFDSLSVRSRFLIDNTWLGNVNERHQSWRGQKSRISTVRCLLRGWLSELQSHNFSS